ncbi:MAG: hypothetical protein ISR73_11400 [Gammaproteobacteria bacterium]|nr:hypothetical protein [Gammaproteobacteria bacterium]
MISRQQLQQAVEQQLLQADQLEPLYQFLRPLDDVSEIADQSEEPLKFIRSFGDVFITLGIVLLMFAINMAQLSGYQYLIPVAGFVLISEWLVRVRKLALPGIALLLATLYFINKAIAFDHQHATTLGLAILSFASLLYYLRYRMPFSLLPFAAGLVAIVILQSGLKVLENPIIFAGLGLAVFVLAMVFDMLDTKRVSQLSDSAFWLHLLAAPLIVHGTMFSMITSPHEWIQSINMETIILLFFTFFFLLALLIDRRAMLISTQLYILYAATQLLQHQFGNSQNIVMYILLGLGFFVIFFGTYWYLARRLIFGFLAGTALSRFVPDLKQRDTRH